MAEKKCFIQSVFNKATAQTKNLFGWDTRTMILATVYGLTVAISRRTLMGQEDFLIYLIDLLFDSIVVGIVFFIVLYIVNLLRSPSLLFYEQNEQIEQLVTKWEGEYIKANVLLESGYPDNRDNQIYVWLNIKNKEKKDLTDCYVVMKKVKIILEQMSIDWMAQVNQNFAHFAWPLFSPEKTKIIHSEKNARVNIAKLVRNEVYFTLENGDSHAGYSSDTKGYYLEIGFNGTMKGKKIEEVLFCGILKKEHNSYELLNETETTWGIVDGKETIIDKKVIPLQRKTEVDLNLEKVECKND